MGYYATAEVMSDRLGLELILRVDADARYVARKERLSEYAASPMSAGNLYHRVRELLVRGQGRAGYGSACLWITGPFGTLEHLPWVVGMCEQLSRQGLRAYIHGSEIGSLLPTRLGAGTELLPDELRLRAAPILPRAAHAVGTDIEGVRIVLPLGDEAPPSPPSGASGWTVVLADALPESYDGPYPAKGTVDGVLLAAAYRDHSTEELEASVAGIRRAGHSILGFVAIGPGADAAEPAAPPRMGGRRNSIWEDSRQSAPSRTEPTRQDPPRAEPEQKESPAGSTFPTKPGVGRSDSDREQVEQEAPRAPSTPPSQRDEQTEPIPDRSQSDRGSTFPRVPDQEGVPTHKVPTTRAQEGKAPEVSPRTDKQHRVTTTSWASLARDESAPPANRFQTRRQLAGDAEAAAKEVSHRLDSDAPPSAGSKSESVEVTPESLGVPVFIPSEKTPASQVPPPQGATPIPASRTVEEKPAHERAPDETRIPADRIEPADPTVERPREVPPAEPVRTSVERGLPTSGRPPRERGDETLTKPPDPQDQRDVQSPTVAGSSPDPRPRVESQPDPESVSSLEPVKSPDSVPTPAPVTTREPGPVSKPDASPPPSSAPSTDAPPRPALVERPVRQASEDRSVALLTLWERENYRRSQPGRVLSRVLIGLLVLGLLALGYYLVDTFYLSGGDSGTGNEPAAAQAVTGGRTSEAGGEGGGTRAVGAEPELSPDAEELDGWAGGNDGKGTPRDPQVELVPDSEPDMLAAPTESEGDRPAVSTVAINEVIGANRDTGTHESDVELVDTVEAKVATEASDVAAQTPGPGDAVDVSQPPAARLVGADTSGVTSEATPEPKLDRPLPTVVVADQADDVVPAELPAARPPSHYVVHLSSVRLVDEADSEVDRFVAKGVDAEYQLVDIPGKGAWYRVFTGRFATFSEARAHALNLKAKDQVSAAFVIGRGGHGQPIPVSDSSGASDGPGGP